MCVFFLSWGAFGDVVLGGTFTPQSLGDEDQEWQKNDPKELGRCPIHLSSQAKDSLV